MDNVTHTLVGLAIAKTRLGEASRLAFPAIVLAANLPDFDFVVEAFGGRAAYLVHHRGITHSLLGVVIQIPLFTTIVWMIEKLLFRKRNGTPGVAEAAPARTSWLGLCAGIATALATQPILDWTNTYGWRPWLPFDHTWYYGDLAFIVDPCLWLIFGGAAGLAGRRSRLGSVAYAALAAITCLLMGSVAGFGFPAAPAWAIVIFAAAVVALAVARWWGVGRACPNRVVAFAALISAVYLSGLGWAGSAAWSRHHGQLVAQFAPGESLQRRMSSPLPVDPLTWELIAQTERAVYRQRAHVVRGPLGAATRLPRKLDDPRVQAALQTPEGRAWLYFARFPIARVEHASRATSVLLLDARYPVEPPERNWCRMRVELPSE